MSRRYWVPIIAACGIALVATASARPIHKDASHQPSAAHSSANEPTSNAKPSELVPIKNAVERAASALEAANAKPESAYEREHAKQDLEAQKRMAKWAFWMVAVGAFEAAITALGVFLVYKTLGYTRDAANYTRDAAQAAHDAVDEAKNATAAANTSAAVAVDTAQRELRAYISVIPAAINQLIKTTNIMGHVIVRNVGKLPAHNVFVQVKMKIAPRNATDFPVPEDTEAVKRTIQPNAEMRQGSIETLKTADAATPDSFFFVWGVVYYDDGYNKRRFTRFCHRYATASRNRIFNLPENPLETRIIIESDKARYHTEGNEAN